MKIWREKVYLWARLTLNQGIVWMSSRFRIRWSISLQNLVTIIIFVFNIIIIIKKMVITILTWEWSLWRARKWAPQAETQGFLSSSSPSSNCICMLKENCKCICVCNCMSLSFSSSFEIRHHQSQTLSFDSIYICQKSEHWGWFESGFQKRRFSQLCVWLMAGMRGTRNFTKLTFFPLIISSAYISLFWIQK